MSEHAVPIDLRHCQVEQHGIRKLPAILETSAEHDVVLHAVAEAPFEAVADPGLVVGMDGAHRLLVDAGYGIEPEHGTCHRIPAGPARLHVDPPCTDPGGLERRAYERVLRSAGNGGKGQCALQRFGVEMQQAAATPAQSYEGTRCSRRCRPRRSPCAAHPFWRIEVK